MSPLPPDRFWSHPPQSINQRTPVPVPMRPSAPTPPAARPPGGGGVGPNPMTSQSHYSLADIQRATNVLRTPSTPVSIQTPAPSMPVTSTADQRGMHDYEFCFFQFSFHPLGVYIIIPNSPLVQIQGVQGMLTGGQQDG